MNTITIENQHWTIDERQNVQIILEGWNLTFDKQYYLQNQIKKIKNYELFINLLLNSNGNWETLQQNIASHLQKLYNSEQFDDQLITQFYRLNGKDYSEEFNLVQTCLQILLSDQNMASSLNFSNFYFSNENSLQIEDLLQLCIGVKQNFSYYPRLVQLISVVLLYNHEIKQGRLAQIYTGEGKTLIVAMLAVLLCKKRNCNVDIVTSSAVLAKRDSEEYAKFYKYFQLSVAHNIHKNEQIQDGVLPCYKCQIIYGDASSFQADILRHEYSEQGTMGNRKQQYAIIDEVDSMLIDGHRNKTLLSSPIPGMLDLSKVITLIWDEICKVQQYLSTDFKVMIIDKDNYYSVDLEEYIEKTLERQLNNCVEKLIPRFRLNYINHMKKTWIKNAICAKFYLKEDRDYVIRDGIVRIVDFQNTGVIQSGNTQWEKALHQFIQLKHNVSVTPLSITTNYLSNVTFFLRYQEKLIGLTGTLGSQNTQNLLAQQYNVDFLFVPPFKVRNLREEFSMALPSEQEWLNEISNSVQTKMNQQRAVLIINRTIKEVEKIEQLLGKQHQNIFKYTDDSQVISQNIGPKGIVVATNLAGRGTDFITNQELENNGGLHVILSFLPQSIRTQEQGFGRTCRQGKKGSAQLIVHFQQNLYKRPEQSFEKYDQAIEYYQSQVKANVINLIDVVKFFRNQNEQYHMEQIEEEMRKLLHEDQCFDRFCQIAKSMASIKTNRQRFRCLEEKWGLFLEINQNREIQIPEIDNYFKLKENENPKYQILEALEQESLQKMNCAAQDQQDPFSQYYKGLLLINEKKYNEGAQALLVSKQLFDCKIQNEKAFGVATGVNQIQIDHQRNDVIIPNREQPIQIQDFENLQNGIFDAPEDQNLRPMQQINNQQPTQQISNQQSMFQISNQLPMQQIGNQQPLQQISNPQANADRISQKVNNHIKIYKKVIDNIDEVINTLQNFDEKNEELDLEWVNVLDEDVQDTAKQDQALKDQIEVINDGPLPRLGKIVKKRKRRNFWKYLALFVFGLCQFAIGAIISVYSAGAAMPIARALMKGGISDMVLAATSYFKGLDIDWKAWGQNKLVDLSTALLLAGPQGIREAIDIGGRAMKTIQQEGLGSFISKFGQVSAQELKKSGSTLNKDQKQMIENSNQTLQQISKIAGLNLNFNDVQSMAQDVIQDQVRFGSLSQDRANEINELVTSSIDQAQQGDGSLKNAFVSMASKYLKAQIGQAKANQVDQYDQQEVRQIYSNQCKEKYNQIRPQIDDFQQYEQRLTQEMDFFTNRFLQIYKSDIVLQKKVITIDLYFDLLCDQSAVAGKVNDSNIQRLVRKHFNINNKSLQQACLNLQVTNQQSMQQFYNENIVPLISQIVNQFNSQINASEPLEIILKKQIQSEMGNLSNSLKEEKSNLENWQVQLEQQKETLNQRGNQQQLNEYNQWVETYNQVHDSFKETVNQSRQIEESRIKEIIHRLVEYLVQNQKIIGNGLSFTHDILEEVNIFFQHQNLNHIQIEIFQRAMNQSIEQAPNIYQTCNKILSIFLTQAIEHQVLDEIKKFVFESKLQQKDQKICERLN